MYKLLFPLTAEGRRCANNMVENCTLQAIYESQVHGKQLYLEGYIRCKAI